MPIFIRFSKSLLFQEGNEGKTTPKTLTSAQKEPGDIVISFERLLVKGFSERVRMTASITAPESLKSINTPVQKDEFDDLIPAWFELIKGLVKQKESFSPMSQGEGRALLLLSSSPEGLCSGELCARMNLTTGRMANILHQLDDKGYIEREAVPTNRRKTKITLTAAGVHHIDTIMCEAKSKASDVLRRLGREDAETLIRIFKKLADNECGPPGCTSEISERQTTCPEITLPPQDKEVSEHNSTLTASDAAATVKAMTLERTSEGI